MPDSAPGERRILVRGVFAPWLANLLQPRNDVCPARVQERAKDRAARARDDWMDRTEALGPGAAQQPMQDGLRLVIQGMRGGHRIGLAPRQQIAKPVIPQMPRRFFECLSLRLCNCRGIDAVLMQRKSEARGQLGDKALILVGLCAANAVVQVGDGEDETDFRRGLSQRAQQRNGIRTARHRDSDTHAWAEQGSVEMGRRCHAFMLRLRTKPVLRFRSILLIMLKTRQATVSDAALITRHRRRMFVDAGRADTPVLSVMADAHEPWVAKEIAAERYLGWITEDDGTPVAGAGLLLLDWPPHPLDPRSTQRGYLLNVYVEPEYRRRKLASNLIEMALAEARRRYIRVVALHSTEEGRRLYEANGFRSTNEMFYVEPIEP